MRTQMWTALSLTFLLACKPGDQTGGTRDARHDKDDLLIERVADSSIPVSGTNLVFSVDSGVDEQTIDAYIVGYPETLTARNIGNRTFLIEDVPAGDQDLIITGRVAKAGEGFDRGLRLNTHLTGGNRQDLGTLVLPKTGAVKGRLEMEGVSAFQTVTVNFPGTKLPSAKPTADGSYAFANIPVGAHRIGALQTENPAESTGTADIKTEAQSSARRFIVRSTPNIPSNLDVVARSSSLVLSWNTGGGETDGYLVHKSNQPNAAFKPRNGEAYKPGVAEAGDIVYVGNTGYYVDPAAKSGTRYYYRIYAFNKDLVYSEPLIGDATARPQDYAYNNYRLQIDSTASDCEVSGSTQIQQLRFYIDNIWQENDFSANNPIGKIGPYTVNVSSNSIFNNSYEAFHAFQPNNLPWSSADNVFSLTDPFDLDRNLFPNGVYINVQFANAAVQITGMEILGGEPPFLPQCAPDRYHLEGSNDGLTWNLIPGSTHSQVTLNRVRYYFTPQNRALTPGNFKLLANEGQVQASWESSAGNEIGYLLARSQTPVPFKPEAGRPYNAGKQGDYDVVAVGNSTTFLDTALDASGAVYYYTLVSYDSNYSYSTAVVGRAVPEPRKTYRFYRFVVDSILGGDALPTYASWVDDLKLQINGQWITAYDFTGPRGKIGGRDVLVSESSMTGTNRGWQVFAPGYWQSLDGKFTKFGLSHAIAKTGEYLQFDFANAPVAISGFQVLGNDAIDPGTGDFSDAMFAQVPDGIRWERSLDGATWEVIPGSQTTSLTAEVVTVEW